MLAKDNSISNHSLLKNLLDPDMGLCKGIEGVLSVQTLALVAKGGVESVVESMVSVMEAHSPASRGLLNQQRIEDEMMVSWNGEDIYHCDGIVEETMRAYKGNFIRRSGRVNDYFVSKAIDSMAKKPAKLEIMARK